MINTIISLDLSKIDIIRNLWYNYNVENVSRSRVVRVINNPEREMLVAPGWCEV